jgi:hypothetical protein
MKMALANSYQSYLIANNSTEESEKVRRDDLQADAQKVRCHKYRSIINAHSHQYIGH